MSPFFWASAQRDFHWKSGRAASTQLPVDAGDGEHERDGLALAVARPADLERAARAGADVAVAGAVDHALGQVGLPPGLVLDDDARDRAVLDQRRCELGVVDEVDARLAGHPLQDELEALDLEPDAVFVLVAPAAVHDAVADLAGDAGDDLPPRAGLGEGGDVGVSAGGGDAAQAVELLDDERAHAAARRAERRPDPGRPAADHDDVILPGHRQLPRGLRDCLSHDLPPISQMDYGVVNHNDTTSTTGRSHHEVHEEHEGRQEAKLGGQGEGKPQGCRKSLS